MACTLVRARLSALVAVLPLALVLQSNASGQEPALEVFYTKLEPKEQFKYKWKGKEAVCTAGVFRWEVPAPEKGGEFGTNGLDRNFTGYCNSYGAPQRATPRLAVCISAYRPREGVCSRPSALPIADR